MDYSSMPPPPPRQKNDLRKIALSGTGMGPAGPTGPGLLGPRNPAATLHLPSHGTMAKAQADTQEPMDAEDWHAYWDECKQVQLPNRAGVFNVYCAGSTGPILLAIHGAGYTGRTWSLVAATLKSRYRIVAPDLRGHGLTTVQPDTDFSKETLAEDVVAIWKALFQPTTDSTVNTQRAPAQAQEGATSLPDSSTAATLQAAQQDAATTQAMDTGHAAAAAPSAGGDPLATAAAPSAAAAAGGDSLATLIVGHSMGGAVAVWAAASRQISHLAGCVVVDVVEGTALAALPHMMGVIASRPTSFPSTQAAIKWAVQTGMSRCKAAARISIPSQLTPMEDTQNAAQAGPVEDTHSAAVGGTQSTAQLTPVQGVQTAPQVSQAQPFSHAPQATTVTKEIGEMSEINGPMAGTEGAHTQQQHGGGLLAPSHGGRGMGPSLMTAAAAIPEGEEEGDEEKEEKEEEDVSMTAGPTEQSTADEDAGALHVQDDMAAAATQPAMMDTGALDSLDQMDQQQQPGVGQQPGAHALNLQPQPEGVHPGIQHSGASGNTGHAGTQTTGHTGHAGGGWRWRTPLVATQPYWQGWYTGLSDAFLSLPIPKMLLLAGTDRLDKTLTIGQMQGKFQLVLLPTAGHAIQEDDAPATAAALDSFASRQRIGQPPLTLPRAPPGTRPVLPVVAGPVLHR